MQAHSSKAEYYSIFCKSTLFGSFVSESRISAVSSNPNMSAQGSAILADGHKFVKGVWCWKNEGNQESLEGDFLVCRTT